VTRTSNTPAALARDAWWEERAPACRLATFRTALAVTTLLFHLPQTTRMIRGYLAVSFHEPMIAGLPGLAPAAGVALEAVRWLAGVGLLLGLWPQASAGALALSGAYLFALDTEHYSHNLQFHLLLLALLTFSQDRLTLWRLIERGAKDDDPAVCPAWPEHLIRLQVAIVFFFAAVDKVFSPAWGLDGERIRALAQKPHRLPLHWLQELNAWACVRFPAVAGVMTIVVEFVLALAIVSPATWGAAVLLGVGFSMYLEFAVEQATFAWDVLTTMLLFLPAADRAQVVRYSPSSGLHRAALAVFARLDWLRRMRWEARDGGRLEVARKGGTRPERGVSAWSALLLAVPGPLLVGLTVVRFVSLARGWSNDLMLLAFGAVALACGPALLAGWQSGARRVLERPASISI
jgi:HTTM domain